MANLTKKSLDELLRLDSAFTELFRSGINGLISSTDEEAFNLFLVLSLQKEIQEEIRERILSVIPLPELETSPKEK